MIKFEIGKTYSTRSICDSNCIISITVLKRTEKQLTALVRNETKKLRIKLDMDGNESVMPWGRYSMAPMITAE